MKPFYKGILSLALSGALVFTSVDTGVLAVDVNQAEASEELNSISESNEAEIPESPENLGGGGLCLGRNDRI